MQVEGGGASKSGEGPCETQLAPGSSYRNGDDMQYSEHEAKQQGPWGLLCSDVEGGFGFMGAWSIIPCISQVAPP